MYLVMTCNYEISVAADEIMTHIKVLQSTVAFSLKVRGSNVITCKLKSRNSVAASTVTVAVVPCTLIQ